MSGLTYMLNYKNTFRRSEKKSLLSRVSQLLKKIGRT